MVNPAENLPIENQFLDFERQGERVFPPFKSPLDKYFSLKASRYIQDIRGFKRKLGFQVNFLIDSRMGRGDEFYPKGIQLIYDNNEDCLNFQDYFDKSNKFEIYKKYQMRTIFFYNSNKGCVILNNKLPGQRIILIKLEQEKVIRKIDESLEQIIGNELKDNPNLQFPLLQTILNRPRRRRLYVC
ncbi:MAG: hypothetical protein ACLFPL_04600 [Candidatus Nanoarchaeia archaeon]